ncbi:DUF6965 family protein [Pedobacter agri]|uniref:DUF6965 family protein n=1 Tax=Pedobacter agri TaxID=454586 RepID=UPI00292ECE31|nr:hypothetical protein [Pedobacter agri]
MTIQEYEDWFNSVEIPKGEILLVAGTTIIDSEKFPSVSIATLKANPDAKANAAIWFRLMAFKLLIESNL